MQLLRPDSVDSATAELGNGSVALAGGTDRVPLDAAGHDAADVDEPLGLHEPVAQLRHELRASRQRLVTRLATEGRELFERARPNQLQRVLALALREGPAGSPRA